MNQISFDHPAMGAHDRVPDIGVGSGTGLAQAALKASRRFTAGLHISVPLVASAGEEMHKRLHVHS